MREEKQKEEKMDKTKASKIKITIEYELPIEKVGNKLLVYDNHTLTQLLGTSSVIGNHKYYGIEKKNNHFVVSIENIKSRLKKLYTDKALVEKKISFIEKVLEAMNKE